nr:coat protein 2 [Allium deltapartitivirus]
MADATKQLEPASKKRKHAETSPELSIVVSTKTPGESSKAMETDTAQQSELIPRQLQRLTLDVNPAYIRKLKDREELGYMRAADKQELEVKSFELDPKALRDAMTGTLKAALTYRWFAHTSMSNTQIETQINKIAPYIVDMCMSALYAKLRNIHKAYGKHGTRYPSAPLYNKDFELPLPFALAIQELGVIQTHSMETNYLLVPTYPEGTQNEGRSSADFPGAQYMSYVPKLKSNGILCKSVDTRIKHGSAWWTFKVENAYGTSDLVGILPPSHYSDLSAQLRALFLHCDEDDKCQDIIKLDANTATYTTKLRDFLPGFNVRTFLALIHAPKNEWTAGTC